jgi:hypothetical protein
MKYKVGDKVRIVEEFLPDSHIGGDMPDYRGKVMTIKETRVKTAGPAYWMEEDQGAYYWLEKTIAGYAYRITIEEFFANTDKLAINCTTEEEAQTLFAVFRRMCKTWNSGDAYIADRTHWSDYGDSVCYSNQGTYGTTANYAAPQLYKFGEVDYGTLGYSENAMRVLLRDTLEWETAAYDKDKNRIVIERTGATVEETNILAIKNDERAGYLKCPKCNEIVKNTPEDIAAHLTKKTNCLVCPHVRDNTISKIGTTYEKMPDGTYIKNSKTSCNLYCNQTWSGTDINSPEIERACKYRSCSADELQTLDGFFGKYPDAFDVVATVDTIADKWKFTSSWSGTYNYRINSKIRVTAVVNNKGAIRYFQYGYYENDYYFTYSVKYHKIIWIRNGVYAEEAPSNIKAQNIARLTNIMKEIYEEKTK